MAGIRKCRALPSIEDRAVDATDSLCHGVGWSPFDLNRPHKFSGALVDGFHEHEGYPPSGAHVPLRRATEIAGGERWQCCLTRMTSEGFFCEGHHPKNWQRASPCEADRPFPHTQGFGG